MGRDRFIPSEQRSPGPLKTSAVRFLILCFSVWVDFWLTKINVSGISFLFIAEQLHSPCPKGLCSMQQLICWIYKYRSFSPEGWKFWLVLPSTTCLRLKLYSLIYVNANLKCKFSSNASMCLWCMSGESFCTIPCPRGIYKWWKGNPPDTYKMFAEYFASRERFDYEFIKSKNAVYRLHIGTKGQMCRDLKGTPADPMVAPP